MNKYVGTKIIYATPMNAQRASAVLNRPIDTSNADEEGSGYLVQYKDGYMSWSPKKQFEEAYELINNMGFEDALICLKQGYKAARKGWNGKGMWIRLRVARTPQELSYLEMKTVGDKFVPWLASQTDMLAEDWLIVELEI